MNTEQARTKAMMFAGTGLLLIGIAAIIISITHIVHAIGTRHYWVTGPGGLHSSAIVVSETEIEEPPPETN